MTNANTVVVLDFETTGLSPDCGDRVIEIGAMRVENGKVVAYFQELMNPGKLIDNFIEDYTGITNAMLKDAPPCNEVMHRLADFIGGYNLVAHNASFDKRFLDAELSRICRNYTGEFACSLLTARRIYQNSPNHKLATLLSHINIPIEGAFHRALYDSDMTTRLWLAMLDNITKLYEIDPIPFALIQKLSKISKTKISTFLQKW
jgi:DNA polymerase-3 subunit epsilon